LAATFDCTLVTPDSQVLDKPVTYASIPAWDGLVGLLPKRAPLLVRLGDGPLRLEFEDGQTQQFFLGGGFAQMQGNRLSMVTDEAVPQDQIVKQDAQAALSTALEMPSRSEQEASLKQRKLARARSLINLSK